VKKTQQIGSAFGVWILLLAGILLVAQETVKMIERGEICFGSVTGQTGN
jgi:hypothetical protein